jgi:hypothetical protein
LVNRILKWVLPCRFVSANLQVNKFKNRLVNILPFESSRVCLQPLRGLEGSDYINASFIDGYRYGSPAEVGLVYLAIRVFLGPAANMEAVCEYGCADWGVSEPVQNPDHLVTDPGPRSLNLSVRIRICKSTKVTGPNLGGKKSVKYVSHFFKYNLLLFKVQMCDFT